MVQQICGGEELKEITITDTEFIDVAGMLYAALIKNGTITEADKQKYLEITTGLMFIFTDEYQNTKGDKK